MAVVWLGGCGGSTTSSSGSIVLDLVSPHEGVRQAAQRQFLARGAAAVPDLSLADSSPVELKAASVRMLGEIGPRAASAVPWMIRALESHPLLSIDVSSALDRIGAAGTEHVLVALPAGSTPTRVVLTNALAIRPAPDAVLWALVTRLDTDPDEDVRVAAARALGWLRQSTPDVIRALTSAAEARGSERKFHAATALGELGVEGVGVLLRLVRDADDGVRRAAVSGLGSGPGDRERRLAALIAALDDDSAHVRRVAANSLGGLGRDAQSAVEPLRDRARRWAEDGQTRESEAAADAVERIEGGEEKIAVPRRSGVRPP